MPSRAAMNRSMQWSLLVGVAVSAVALYLAFRNVPFDPLWNSIGSVDYFYLALSLVVVAVFLIAKVVRWQIILGVTHRVSFGQSFHPMMIGFMLNCILPGRLGELARPAVLHRQSQVPFATGLATVVAERLLDSLTLLTMFAWVLSAMNIAGGEPVMFAGRRLDSTTVLAAGWTTLYLVLALIAAILMISLAPVRRQVAALLQWLPRAIPALTPARRQWLTDRVSRPLASVLDHLAAGLALVRRPQRLLVCIGLSAGIWLLAVASFYILALGFPGIDLTLTQMAVVLVLISFCIALPSVPGWWGLWEAGGVFALSLFGVEPGAAAGFTLINHAAQIFPIILIGLVSMLITGVRVRAIVNASRRA